MQLSLLYNVLQAQLHSGRDVNLTVSGISMEPSFYAGDVVTIRQTASYEVGDIVVFRYTHDELLNHRLL